MQRLPVIEYCEENHSEGDEEDIVNAGSTDLRRSLGCSNTWLL